MDVSALPNFMPPGPGNLKEKIYAQVGPDLARIEEEIRRLLDSDIPLISRVGRYIMDSGGKRLRPLLMILSSRLCGYGDGNDIPLAVVFEFLHAAALLHDDVVDHAEFRRSHPAANIIWGNAAVVLVGDFLYSKSIQMAVAYRDVRMLQVLFEATTKMSEGEVLQLINSDNLEVTEDEYLEVITRKTAVLISAACQIGAILGGASATEENALRAYGHHIGIAFQLIDDTLDFTGEAEELENRLETISRKAKRPFRSSMPCETRKPPNGSGSGRFSSPTRFGQKTCVKSETSCPHRWDRIHQQQSLRAFPDGQRGAWGIPRRSGQRNP